jgi:hypothetical protein
VGNHFSSQFGLMGCVFLLSTSLGSVALASHYDQLTPDQQKELNKGGQVAVFTPVANSSWPECKVYQMIKASPEEAAAVFHDYEKHKEYFPNVKQSSIVKVIDRATVQVSYMMEIPLVWPLSPMEEHYTVQDHVKSTPADGSYEVSWNLVRADNATRTEGETSFEPVGTSTLMSYRTIVVTTRTGASWVVESVKQAAKDAAHAIVNRIQNFHDRNDSVLQDEVSLLREALR